RHQIRQGESLPPPAPRGDQRAQWSAEERADVLEQGSPADITVILPFPCRGLANRLCLGGGRGARQPFEVEAGQRHVDSLVPGDNSGEFALPMGQQAAAHQLRREQADAPEPDLADHSQRHPHQGPPPQGRIAENGTQVAQPHLRPRRRGSLFRGSTHRPGQLASTQPPVRLFHARPISTTSRLGITPNQKRTRHPAVWPKVVWGPTSRLSPDPMIAPTEENAWTSPRANGRARAGMVSATSATPTAYSPPMPIPHRK